MFIQTWLACVRPLERKCVYVCVLVCVYLCLCVYLCQCVCLCLCVSLSVTASASVCVCVYVEACVALLQSYPFHRVLRCDQRADRPAGLSSQSRYRCPPDSSVAVVLVPRPAAQGPTAG